MSIADVLDRWRAEGRSADAGRADEILQTLRRSVARGLENLESDPLIDDPMRAAFVEALLRASTGQWLEVALEFCRAGLRHGPPRARRPEQFGHAIPVRNLEKRLPKSGASGLVWGSDGAALEALLRRDLEGQKRYLANFHLAQHQMWSFHQDGHPDDPFHAVSTRSHELRRRLGLGHVAPEHALAWCAHVPPASLGVHLPTTLDSDLNPWFRPGGRSQPLSGDDGLPEVVHESVGVEALTQPLRRAL